MKATVKEVTASVSIGGKMQIVQYQFTSDYHYSYTQKYEVEDMTEEQAAAFRKEKIQELRVQIEPEVQKEVDALIEQRDQLRGS